jgi:hypothetical protein
LRICFVHGQVPPFVFSVLAANIPPKPFGQSRASIFIFDSLFRSNIHQASVCQ